MSLTGTQEGSNESGSGRISAVRDGDLYLLSQLIVEEGLLPSEGSNS